MKPQLIIILIFITLSCNQNKSSSELNNNNRSSNDTSSQTGNKIQPLNLITPEIFCATKDIDDVFNKWDEYKCDFYKLYDEDCFEYIANINSFQKIRLWIIRSHGSVDIYNFENNGFCTSLTIKIIPSQKFSYFTYLVNDQIIEYSVKRKLIEIESLSGIINNVKNHFLLEEKIIDEFNINYIIETLNPDYTTFFAIDSLNQRQQEIINFLTGFK